MKRVILLLPLLALAWVDWVVLREVYVDWYVYPGSRGEQYFLIGSLLALNLVGVGFWYLFDRRKINVSP